MRILVVQESDWLEQGSHQSHHLTERLSQRGHEVKAASLNQESRGRSEIQIGNGFRERTEDDTRVFQEQLENHRRISRVRVTPGIGCIACSPA